MPPGKHKYGKGRLRRVPYEEEVDSYDSNNNLVEAEKVDEGIRAVPGMIGTPLPDINENFRIVDSNRPEDTPVRKETTETESSENVHVLAPIQSTSNLLHARQNMSDDSSSSVDNVALLSRDRGTNSLQFSDIDIEVGPGMETELVRSGRSRQSRMKEYRNKRGGADNLGIESDFFTENDHDQ